MKEKFPKSIGVSINDTNDNGLCMKIYDLLHPGDDGTRYERWYPSFNMSDIFNTLPHSITYNGHRGDLNVSVVDIAYFSIGSDWKHVLVHHEPIPFDGTIYDAFYNMIVWLKKNNLM